MSDSLFREKAIEHQRLRLYGDVLLLPKASHFFMSLIILIWFLLVIIWLCNGSYTKKETVSGWLEPPTGLIRIYSQSNGKIEKVLVSEGEYVIKDQTIAIVNDDRMLINGELLESKLIHELDAHLSMLSKQLESNKVIFSSKENNLKQKIETSRDELKLLDDQLGIINDKILLLDKQIARYNQLQKKSQISQSDLEKAINDKLSAEMERAILQRDKINKNNALSSYRNDLRIIPDEVESGARDIREKISATERDIIEISGKKKFIVKAPIDGTVNNLQITEGQNIYINDAVPLLSILPKDANLVVHLLVPVKAAGFLKSGQEINVRYDAFPYQKFGIYTGLVKSVSKTILLPKEVLNSPLQMNEPVYRVTAELEYPFVKAYGEKFPLKPGMTLSADVKLTKRSLLEWIFEPIYSLQGQL